MINQRRILLYLVVPTLLLLAAGLVVTLDFFGPQGVELDNGASSSGGAAQAAGTVSLDAEIFSDVSNPDLIYMALTQATLPAVEGGVTADFYCLEGIYVTPALDLLDGHSYPDLPYNGPAVEDALPAFRLDPPLCNYVPLEGGGGEALEEANSDLIIQPEEPLELFLDRGEWSIRFYPFDTLAGRWDVYALVKAADGAVRRDVAPLVSVTAELADWEEQITLGAQTLRFESGPESTTDWTAERMLLQFKRTRTQRLLTVVMLGFVTVLIVGLIFIRDSSQLLEIVIGILLGLWGIQAVLIPGYIQNRTLVHYWIILLYIVLGLITYVRLVGIPLVHGDAAEAIASLDDELEGLDDEEEHDQ